MKTTQLSLFLENRPGHLGAIVRSLGEAGVNIIAITLADTEQFGVVRMIVKELDKARKALEAMSAVVKETEVVAIEVEDQPGGLGQVLTVLDEAGINVEYMYGFRGAANAKAVMILRFTDDPDQAVAVLEKAGIGVVDPVEAYRA